MQILNVYKYKINLHSAQTYYANTNFYSEPDLIFINIQYLYAMR